MRKLINDLHAVVDSGVVIMIGVAFAGLMVLAYIIWQVNDKLLDNHPAYVNANNLSNANRNNSLGNITSGWDSGVNLILIAITIFILAIAISALLMLRGRQ